jgi:hypothetical protein
MYLSKKSKTTPLAAEIGPSCHSRQCSPAAARPLPHSPSPVLPAMTTRQLNRQRRNERIRLAFRQRYLDTPRPRKFSREYVLAVLADEFCLSVSTIEDIVYTRPGAEDAAATHGKNSRECPRLSP